MSNTNGVLLRHLFQLAEGDNQDDKIVKLLSETISSLTFKRDKAFISFSNGIEVVISHSFDTFHIYISDAKMYYNDETAFTPIGTDRVLWYLKNIAQYKYYWRNK